MFGSIGKDAGANGRVSLPLGVVGVVVVDELVTWKSCAESTVTNLV